MGAHFFCRGADSLLWHQYPLNATAFYDWLLLPNPHNATFDSDPAVGMNKDGTMEVIARNHDGLDLWHWYQKNASDPLSWVGPREPACLCNFPPCEGQKRCGNNANCGNDGYDCSDSNFMDNSTKWWNSQAIFPT